MKQLTKAQLINTVILGLIGLYTTITYPVFAFKIILTLLLALGFQFTPTKNKPLKWFFAVVFLLSAGILAIEMW